MRKSVLLFLLFIIVYQGSCFSLNPLEQLVKKEIGPAYSSYLKGLLSERYGDHTRALEEYIKAKKFDTDSASVKLRIAVGYVKLDKIEKAFEILEELKSVKPVNLDAYLLLILLHSSKGQEEEANQEYERMLSSLYEEKPDNVKVAESLAQFKLQKRDFDAALDIYAKIIQLDPEYTQGYFWMGFLYEEKGTRPKAIESWKKVLEINPDHVDALNSLGYIYAEEGINLDEAEVLIKKALEIMPDSAAFLDSLGWVYYKQKKFQEAKEYIEKAAGLLYDPVILDHLGDVYYQLGELQKAQDVWSKVLEAGGENEKVQEKVTNIQNEISSSED